MELIQLLTENLGVQENQAQGGAGLIFQLAKDKLGDESFAPVLQSIPGINDLLQAAPKSGGMMGALGGLAASIGGEVGQLGTLATLAGGFSQLGMDSGMISKFLPIVISFVQNQGGDEIKNLLEKVLS
ncbi:MAG: DUF2780 domain-containing protein [Moorea sp. SIOASIH]|uniref:DUF2780 domain-containing protein n=1 Tax=Moorena sp. SIOASIH TaxID=2607817 RepID=UPI0013BAFEEB|nr:DUF2780 domain-containing protein [Moorena sp. SIOASIH]NEO41015.1 DUF2780 domain-containing protein [Moorena sp. SIOASIH]NEO90380.1 DUF2780 domain-containing protein [Moorena sp. SIO3G5]